MDLRITVVGGTGFIGRRLVERLVERGTAVRIVSRHAQNDDRPALRVARLVANLEDPSAIERTVDGAWAVVNLIGTTTAKSKQQFYSLHRDIPGRLAQPRGLRASRALFTFQRWGSALTRPRLPIARRQPGKTLSEK